MNDRIKKIREEFCETNKEFAEMLGVSTQYASNITKVGKKVGPQQLDNILEKFPEVNPVWLKMGIGEMRKNQTIQQIGTVDARGNRGFAGNMAGGNYTLHNDEGKDRLIDEQKQEVDKMFEAIIVAVNGFQRSNERHDEYVVRQDDYIKRQDEYIARIINNSYLRNETNMKRFDLLLEQINKLILMVVEQNQHTQDRADRLVEMLEKKI